MSDYERCSILFVLFFLCNAFASSAPYISSVTLIACFRLLFLSLCCWCVFSLLVSYHFLVREFDACTVWTKEVCCINTLPYPTQKSQSKSPEHTLIIKSAHKHLNIYYRPVSPQTDFCCLLYCCFILRNSPTFWEFHLFTSHSGVIWEDGYHFHHRVNYMVRDV